jgi:hypothetical protein
MSPQNATNMVEVLRYWSPVISIGALVILSILIPTILWARRVDENVTLIKDNHLHTIQDNTAKTNEHLIEIKAILKERH